MVSGLLMMRLLVSMVISFGEESVRLRYMVVQIEVILYRNDTLSVDTDFISDARALSTKSQVRAPYTSIMTSFIISSQPSKGRQKTASQV